MSISPGDWKFVEALFEVAVDLDPVEVPAFLAKNCPDPLLRAEVERLLANYSQLGESLENPIFDQLRLGSGSHEGQFHAGRKLANRFEIIRFIGRGGMGDVYEAKDLTLEKHVAVKVLRRDLLQQRDAVERFKREVDLAQRVTHPNVCRIYDHCSEEGGSQDWRWEIVFFSMELLPGKTLRDYLTEKGYLSIDEALPLLKQMTSALDAIHAQSIVHRDLKPGNIMLIPTKPPERFRVVVTDFGLARQGITSISEAQRGGVPVRDKTLTRPGYIFGTPEYMAPEQREGRPATAASDIYALGLVIFEMLTGNRPSEVATPFLPALRRSWSLPPSHPSFEPDIPTRWKKAILRCLEQNPTDRFAKAEDVTRALEGRDSRTSTSIWDTFWITLQKRYLVPLIALFMLVAGIFIFSRRSSAPNPSDSDHSIAVAIQSDLHQDASLRKDAIAVTVENGVATLQGTVSNDSERALAENIVKEHQRVKSVSDQLILRPPQTTNNGRRPGVAPSPAPTPAPPAPKPPPTVGVESTASTELPHNWVSVDVMEAVGNLVYLGGRSLTGGTLGVYQAENGKFSDLTHLLPPAWCPVRSLAYGDNLLFIGGESRGGCAALYSPDSESLQDITTELPNPGMGMYYYGGIQALGFNGRDFLVGGAGKVASLVTYSPSTRKFGYLSIRPYIAINNITPFGDSFMISGAGLGAGPGQPPALGLISADHVFTNLTGFLPPGWGVTVHAAQDGKEFLIEGRERATDAKLLAIIDASNRTSTDVTSSFPESLDLHSVDGRRGHFLLGGQADGMRYLARYQPSALPTPMKNLLPPEVVNVTAVRIAGNENVVAGLTQENHIILVTFPDKTRN